MTILTQTELRSRFALALSTLYGTEVPAYNTLVDVAHEVNTAVIQRQGAAAERLGSIARVTAERHGAIRVGSPKELAEVARVFGAFGMYPTGFYDLRDAAPHPVPVVSTAFRPTERDELARNPFRIFTSMLVSQDRRFFTSELEARLNEFLDRRTLFSSELLELADRAEQNGGLDEATAERFLKLAATAFALSAEPVDRAWYDELQAISSVAADIGGVASTHINHLTPRVLDIDALYARMQDLGVSMIDEVQGPPRWAGPDVLLRQTSFRALAEPRIFREADGTLTSGDLRVRFGEVEARGIALTVAGRDLYERLVAEVDDEHARSPELSRQEIAGRVWLGGMPQDEADLLMWDLAYFTFHVVPDRAADGTSAPTDLVELLDHGWVTATPIVYEDFLPRSAAGIFSSNLSSEGQVNLEQGGAPRDLDWMARAIGRTVFEPDDLYARERQASLDRVAIELGLPIGVLTPLVPKTRDREVGLPPVEPFRHSAVIRLT